MQPHKLIRVGDFRARQSGQCAHQLTVLTEPYDRLAASSLSSN